MKGGDSEAEKQTITLLNVSLYQNERRMDRQETDGAVLFLRSLIKNLTVFMSLLRFYDRIPSGNPRGKNRRVCFGQFKNKTQNFRERT